MSKIVTHVCRLLLQATSTAKDLTIMELQVVFNRVQVPAAGSISGALTVTAAAAWVLAGLSCTWLQVGCHFTGRE